MATLPTPPSRVEQVYDAIVEAICTGRLTPGPRPPPRRARRTDQAPLGSEVAFETGASLVGGWTLTTIIEGDAVPQVFIPQLIELYRAAGSRSIG